jgi:hypothetical protein
VAVRATVSTMPEESPPNPSEPGIVRGVQSEAGDRDLDALLALSSYQSVWRTIGAFDKGRSRTVLMAALLRLKQTTDSGLLEWGAPLPSEED